MTAPKDQETVALMVRAPIPGRVKTRLAATIGDEAACSLYQAMAADVIAGVRHSGLPLWLFHEGRLGEKIPQAWASAATRMLPQTDGDIGRRMAAAFTACFTAGCPRVILIGSDLPGLDAEVLAGAALALEEADAVIAPAMDGGYGLIGLRRDKFHPELFAHVRWSTNQVLAQTLKRGQRLGLKVRLLAPLRDIDTVADLLAVLQDPSAVRSTAFHQALLQLHLTGAVPPRMPLPT